MFDSLDYAKKLEKTGFSRDQAETQVQMLSQLIEVNLVTKQDFHNLGNKMENHVQRLDGKFGHSIELLEIKLDKSVEALNSKIDRSIEALNAKIDRSVEMLNNKIDRSVNELNLKIDRSVENLEQKMIQMEYRLTIKLGTIVTVVMAAAVTATKLL